MRCASARQDHQCRVHRARVASHLAPTLRQLCAIVKAVGNRKPRAPTIDRCFLFISFQLFMPFEVKAGRLPYRRRQTSARRGRSRQQSLPPTFDSASPSLPPTSSDSMFPCPKTQGQWIARQSRRCAKSQDPWTFLQCSLFIRHVVTLTRGPHTHIPSLAQSHQRKAREPL